MKRVSLVVGCLLCWPGFGEGCEIPVGGGVKVGSNDCREGSISEAVAIESVASVILAEGQMWTW